MTRVALMAGLSAGLGGCFVVPDVDLPLPEAGVVADGAVDRGPGDGAVLDGAPMPDAGFAGCRSADACALPGAAARCEAGRCLIAACDDGQVDLDGLDETGCEYGCRARGEVDGCDGLDDDCDGVVDEDAEVCDCAARCVGPDAESVCRGDVCTIAACGEGLYNGDGRAERGCPCSAEGLTAYEAAIDPLPPGPVDGRVAYPGDGEDGVAVWPDPADRAQLLVRWVDAEGYPLGPTTVVPAMGPPLAVVDVEVTGARQAVAIVRSTEAPFSVMWGDGEVGEVLFEDCPPERCTATLVDGAPVRVNLDVAGDAEVLFVGGERYATWQRQGEPARLMAVECVSAERCMVAVERGETWLYTVDEGERYGARSAVGLAAAGEGFVAALGRAGEVVVERWVPNGQRVSVAIETGRDVDPTRVSAIVAPGDAVRIFVDDGQLRTARVEPDFSSATGLNATGGFFGVGRVGGPAGAVYHDHALRGWRSDALVFDGLPSGAAAGDGPVTAVETPDTATLVYYGPGGLFSMPLSLRAAPPTLLLTRTLARTTPPAATAHQGGVLVAEVDAERVTIAHQREAVVTRWQLGLPPVDAARTTAALHSAGGRALVGVAGRDAEGPIIGLGVVSPGGVVETARTERPETDPALAGPGDERGAMFATLVEFANGRGIHLRHIGADGVVSGPMLRARTYGVQFALAWSAATGRYTLAWLDRSSNGCPRSAGDAVWVQTLAADGAPIGGAHQLAQPLECPDAVRLAPSADGGVHVAINSRDGQGLVAHLGVDGLPVTPMNVVFQLAQFDDDIALRATPTGPAAAWTLPGAVVSLELGCGE